MTAPTVVRAKAGRMPGYIRERPTSVLSLSAPVWSVLLACIGLLVVEVAARTQLVSDLDLVAPTRMVRRALGLMGDGGFVFDQLLPSVGLIATTFVIAACGGVALAYLLWRSPWWRCGMQPYLGVYYAVPIFALYPIMVVLFGTGSVPIVLVSVAFSIVVITTNSTTGFDAVPAAVHKLALARRLTKTQYLTKILLPAAVPDIVGGLRLGLVYAMIGVLGTEFILSARGLGHFIANAYKTFRTEDMYAGILLICVVALVLNVTAGTVLNRIDWRRR